MYCPLFFYFYIFWCRNYIFRKMNNWIILLVTSYPQEAHIAKSYLESEGIEVVLKDELTSQMLHIYPDSIGGVKLLVHESNYKRGHQLLKNAGYAVSENVTSQQPVILVKADSRTDKYSCPFCKSNNIGRKREGNILNLMIYFILGTFFPIFRRSYKCFDCKKVWKYVWK